MHNSAYFKAKFIEQQKETLLDLRSQVMNSLKEANNERFHVSTDETSEDGDLAQVTLDQALAIGLKEKDLFKLREIDAALHRIENGTYGLCEESDDPISEGRLKKIPWTRYSIQAAEELERKGPLRRIG